MAFNPASMMKMMKMKNEFEANHPKFMAYIRTVFSKPIEEGTVMEITVTRPGEQPMTANIVVKQSDLELIEQLKNLT